MMRNLSGWLNEYAKSHQNSTNQLIHKICVPLIYFSVVSLLWCVPLPASISIGLADNLFWVMAVPILGFYLALGFRPWLVMTLFTAICVAVLWWLQFGGFTYILEMAIVLFVIAWIMQFWGHKIEGAKPSFVDDLAFLLIGPLWVFNRFLKT